ncbi:MAG: hypothetical protein WDW38_010184 [Sanguina aurantia]
MDSGTEASQDAALSAGGRFKQQVSTSWAAFPSRSKLAVASHLAFAISNMDKVVFMVAILPMSREFGWSPSISGVVQASFFMGFLLMQACRRCRLRLTVPGGISAPQDLLCDRFADASYAYQGGGRGQPAARIAELEQWACLGLVPDLTLLLDLPVAAGRARAAGRGEADRIETEADAFFERIRATYRDRALAEPARFRVIDASQPQADVLTAAANALAELFGERAA